MARGVQLAQLLDQFRAEVRQATGVSVNPDALPHQRQLLRRTQRLLYAKHDWAFLRMFPTLAISAGSRYYNAPADLNMDRIEQVCVLYNGEPIPIDRGIGFPEYAAFDPTANERSDPIQRWDLRWTGSATQIEVWPLPASAVTLMFQCLRPLRNMVEDSDTCDLDEDLITLFAAAEELEAQKMKDAPMKLQMAQSHLIALQGQAQSGLGTFKLGTGAPPTRPTRATVRTS